MERLVINTNEIVISDNDYKYSNYVMFEKLKRSLISYGQLRPINCIFKDGKYICVEGKFILKALIELDIKVVQVNSFDMSETDYSTLQFVINDLYFKKCDVRTSEILNKMESVDYSLLPFEKEEVNSFIKLLNFDWNEFERKKEGEGQISLFDMVEESEIKQVIEEEKESVSLDIQAFGTNWEDESLRQQYPANVEGSDEFNQTNLIGNKLVEVVEIISEQSQIVNPHIVYKDTSGSLKTMSEEMALLVKEEMGIEIVPLHRATYSDCQIFINQQKE